MDHVASDPDRVKKLKFRAWRRGFREADLILGPFADVHLAGFSDGELSAFEILLDQPDQLLYAWIIGTEPTPVAFDGPLMDRLKAFVPKVATARTDLGA
jgi:antitoxin CptB